MCRSLHAGALQATAREGLAQGHYVAARAGFEPATLLSKGIDLDHSDNVIILGKAIQGFMAMCY